MRFGRKVVLACFFLVAPFIRAEVRLAGIFSSDMVLQQEREIPVWGWAAPGENITVRLNGAFAEGTAGNDGGWMLKLPAMKAGGPFELRVSGSNEVVLTNVMIGEVWICSGQSNMQWRMYNVVNSAFEIQSANHPNLRLFNGNLGVGAMRPQNDLPGKKWNVCRGIDHAVIGNFSGVAYFFGRELLAKLKVPVGLISVCWGGTRIETWIGEEGYRAVPELKTIWKSIQPSVAGTPENRAVSQNAVENMKQWILDAETAIAKGKLIPEYPELPKGLRYETLQQPTTAYNRMIAPLACFPVRGVIWYQGEGNAADGALYFHKMKALALSWRNAFRDPGLPFYFVQLPPFRYGGEVLPNFWKAQQAFAETDPHAYMAVTNDLGDFKDIHPKNKKPVGQRLALLALKYSYGMTQLCADSPFFHSAEVAGNKVIVSFRNATRLKSRDGKSLRYFSLAGPDGQFYPADAAINGGKVVVVSEKVRFPQKIRFAWSDQVNVNLVNENNLPAGAFSVDLKQKGY